MRCPGRGPGGGPTGTPRRFAGAPRGTPGNAEATGAGGALPPGLAVECTDLAARLTAVHTRIAQLEVELVRVAEPLPAYPLLRTIPGVGPTVAAILVAELGDIAWFTTFSQLRKLVGLDIQRVESGQWAGTARISKGGRGLLRWALYQAAVGAVRTAVGRARLAALKAKRHGDRFAGFKATVELAAKLLRLVWGVWRSGRPYDPARVDGGPAARLHLKRGRRGAPPSGKGQAEIAQSSGSQGGRISDRGAVDREQRTSMRRRRSA